MFANHLEELSGEGPGACIHIPVVGQKPGRLVRIGGTRAPGCQVFRYLTDGFYVAGEQAAYMNGHILYVDGGYTAIGIAKE